MTTHGAPRTQLIGRGPAFLPPGLARRAWTTSSSSESTCPRPATVVDTAIAPSQAYLGVLGTTGLADFGFDAAIDYRAGSIARQLAQAAPDGIDVYVDQVGGDHLEAAIGALRVGGRAALVGAISEYNATAPIPGPSNLYQAVIKRLTLRGMLVTEYFHLFPEYTQFAAGWLADGTLHTEETIYEGIDQAPAAFLGVLSGANVGKMLVRFDD